MTTHTGLPARTEEPNEDGLDSAVLERYWLGETSPEETVTLDMWFAEHPERAAWYTQLRRGIANDTWADFSPAKVQRIIGETLNAIAKPHGSSVADERPGVLLPSHRPSSASFLSFTTKAFRGNPAMQHARLSRLVGFAAAIVTVLALAWGGWTYTAYTSSEYAYSTGVGQRITVALADGSRITLAPQTTVRVAPAFGVETRTVFVEGEVHFDVMSAAGLPFTVRSGDVQTRVLGTRFVVKAYPNDRDIHVAVETGKVAVSHETSAPSVLAAGATVSVNVSGRMTTDSTKLFEYTDWVKGQLTFERSPLPDVLATLNRWYGVQFRIADSTLLRTHVSGALAYGSLEDMFKTLKDMLNVSLTYERNNTGSLIVTLRSIYTQSPLRPRYQRELDLPTGVGR